MRRFASFVTLALLLVSVVAPLATACPCREAEVRTSHSCCEETVLRSATPGCCALVDAASVPPLLPQPTSHSPLGIVTVSGSASVLLASAAVPDAPRPLLRSFSRPPSVLRL